MKAILFDDCKCVECSLVKEIVQATKTLEFLLAKDQKELLLEIEKLETKLIKTTGKYWNTRANKGINS